MPSVNDPTIVEIHGQTYDVLRVTGTEVTLRSHASGKTITRHPADLAVTDPAFVKRSPRLVDELAPHLRQRLGALAAHLREVDEGVSRDGSRRPEYDLLTTSQETRVARKLCEMEQAGMRMSRAKFMRKLTAYRKYGLAGLVDGRWIRQHDPRKHIPGPVYDTLLDVLNESVNKSTKTRKYVIEEVRKRVRREHGPNVLLPSDASMYRYLNILGQARNLTASGPTRQSAANRRDKTFAKNTERFPGAEVQVDTHQLDVFVYAGKKTVRPYLTVMLDVATRMVLAFTLRIKATKGVDHVLLIAQALTPRQNRPDLSEVRAALQDQMPDHTLLSWEEYQELAREQPYIHPRRIHMDNGKDYLATSVHDATGAIGGDITLSAVRTPTDKAHVERFFRSLESGFVETLPGHTAGNVNDRGKEPENDDLLTIDMLWALLDDWIMRDYHRRPHASLRDERQHRVNISPTQAATSAVSAVSQFRLPWTREMYLSALEPHWRTITDIGVTHNTRQYDSEELHPYRNLMSPDPRKKGKWPVKVDPYNPRVVWLEIARGKFIECRERGTDQAGYLPLLPPVVDDPRADVARFDAAAAGTPMLQPEPPVLPSVESATYEDDDEDDDFDYTNV
ncbi:hypothetical protein PU630_15570 [Microbacterium horticulturae]|uniref:Integrase catalytic domain-containing protein n=1 Tax=Microbacterium horticulturae TaxID=3028316 RepID=A0ABY8C1Z2_9MICO|nr:hypothetical protein [Microbacterium sp. KACC 23027]WEG08643.1 hypothetical protein PU630_15570 [Microbacterium sp. KACC 23027]